LFSDRGDLAFNACVVAGAIEPAVCVHDDCDESSDVGSSRHVRSRKSSVSALLFYECNGFISAIAIHIRYKNFGTFLGKF
jgi:hypothetical protein